MLTKSIWNDFKNDYPNINIKIKTTNRNYHDRYIAIDYGTANDKVTSIARIEDVNSYLYHPMFDGLLLNPMLKI